MKKVMILLMLVLTVSLFAKGEKTVAQLNAELKSLNNSQKEVMALSYLYGEQQNRGLTLTAIAWREGVFRKDAANPKEGKYGTWGVYQVTMEDALRRNHMKPTKENIEFLRVKLLTDLKFAAEDAMKELKAWDAKHVRDGKANVWRTTLAAYNVGTRADKSPTGNLYAKDIAMRTGMIKKYFNTHPEILADAKEKINAEKRLNNTKLASTLNKEELVGTFIRKNINNLVLLSYALPRHRHQS